MASINHPSLPPAFVQRMQRMLGDAYPAFVAEYEKEPSRALFLRSDRLAADTFVQALDFDVRPIPYLPDGYWLKSDRPGSHPLHHAGAYYVQDPSAMATVSAAPLRPGMRVLDLCAAPGGKSVQLASRIGPGGMLVSNEIQPARCKILCGNIERMGFANVLVSNADAKRVAGWYPQAFDLVLVDAPCSGEGMFRKYEGAVGEWSERAVLACAQRQAELLQAAVRTVAPEGYLLYSTCTFSEEENEQTVREFLRQHPTFVLCDLPERIQAITAPGIGLPAARRFYPHLAPGEGQFMALMQRTDGVCPPAGSFLDASACPDARTFLSSEERAAICDFLQDAVMPEGDLNLCRVETRSGVRLAACPFPVPRENVFSAGITLGSVEKHRLVPHHQLFKALGDRFYRKIDLAPDDPRVRQYLSGAEIDVQDAALPNGWAVVQVCGCTLGGAKLVDGVAKNHYPKGLRIMG